MELGGTFNFNNNNNNKNQNSNSLDSNFSVLDRYGTYVTNEEYITDPAIGRDEQIKQLILVLLTPEKSAILIGKPGIGKTAIVEGLAYRIQKNKVPDALLGYQIINIKTASLLGTMPNGETKVQKMIDELKTKEKLILFIDEIHMLIGSTESSSLDFANIFKEGLGRGSIKVIGATTTEEYERYILRDKAFTRRFQKIDVPEPTRDETIKIMMGTLPKFEKQTGRKMKYTSFIQQRIMSFIVDITSEYKRIFSLGSRYPDVCLTLLKQAFSYTVYDNRPYMDIFDVRKAIENSKNIYPDVIKKELPNFDKMFNDIILEEKGEKPIEEWRKDNIPIRNDIENVKTASSSKTEEDKNEHGEKKLYSFVKSPDIVDKVEIKSSKPLSSIIDSGGKKKYAKVGTITAPVGIKEKLNKTSNVGALDDMLLSSNVSVLKNDPKENERVINYVVTDEIKNGVSDDYLFSRPILSTIEPEEEKTEQVVKYKLGNRKKEREKMWNDNNRPDRFDISNQNFDKYQNYFHQDSMNNNYNEDQERMNMLMGNNYSNNNLNGQMFDGGMNNNPYDTMNNNYGIDPYNNQMNQDFSNNYPMNPPYNSNMEGTNYDMNMNYMQQSNPMNQMYNQPDFNYNNQNDGSYSPFMNNNVNDYNSNYNPMDFNNSNNFVNNNSFGLMDQSNNGYKGETLFGAPMYSDNNEISKSSTSNYNIDNNQIDDTINTYGPLLPNEMQIKNGGIVNEFPTFDKLNNLSNITASMNDLSPNQMNDNYYMPNNMMNQNNMFGPNQMMPNQEMNQNKNWTFIDDHNKPTLFQKNILDEAKKHKDNNISSKEKTAAPTNNGDYYADMKNGDFVNFSDLNKGKVKEEESNKYMGVQVNENKPQFDLNLENNAEEEKFDDFYE